MRGAPLHALAFLTSGAVLVAELAAPRLLARHLGTNLFTWAATIATFLGGLALGHAWGGRLADRHGTRPLPLLLLLSGGALLAALPLDAFFAGSAWLRDLPHLARVLLAVPLVFLPAAFLLGTLTPLLARALLVRTARAGTALGLLSAAGSLGAVLGVLGAGYALIPTTGTRTLLAGTAAGLGVLGLVALPLLRSAAAVAATAPALEAPRGTPLTLRAVTGLAFLAGQALLTVEILAGRVAVVGLGNSVYTWTAVLCVVLAGAALGAWLGGRRADRRPGRAAVAELLTWSVLGVGICLWTPLLMARVISPALPWPLAVLLSVAVGFLPASIALGALPPALARAALLDPARHGRTVGRLQAVGTLGAVVGALLTAFLLVPLCGVPVVVCLLTLALAFAADQVTGTRALLPVRAVLTLLVVLTLIPGGPPGTFRDVLQGFGRQLGLREDARDVWIAESGYYRIRVQPERDRWCLLSRRPDVEAMARDPVLADRVRYDERRRRLFWDGAPMDTRALTALVLHVDAEDVLALTGLAQRTHHHLRQMALDKLTHGFVDLKDPTWVGYDYELVAAAVWKRAPRAGQGQRAFFVGGGPYTFQRRLLTLDPKARLVTAEIDPAVTAMAMARMGLQRHASHQILHEDARLALPHADAGPGGTFDVVFGDAFNDFSVPYHLTTREFAEDVRARLSPGGLYLVNVVDAWHSGRFLGAFHTTLAQVFGHTAILSLGPRSDATRETFVLVASDTPLALDGLQDDLGRPLEIVRYGEADLADLRARSGDLVLTDDFAPVEALLAPVARSAGD